MELNGISNMMNLFAGYGTSKSNRGATNTGATEEPDIDREENTKLAAKMYFAATTSDATAAYFGALQDALKDSKDGFEAYRRVTKLTSTQESVVSSDAYASKKEAKSIVKDFTEAIDEKRKEIEEIVEKRKEKENSSDVAEEEITETKVSDSTDNMNNSSESHSIASQEHGIIENEGHSGIANKYAFLRLKNDQKSDSHTLSRNSEPTRIDTSV